MGSTLNANLRITGSELHTPGLASEQNGEAAGHVTISHHGGDGGYAGSLSISSDDPDTLRSIGRAMFNAANELVALRAEVARRDVVDADNKAQVLA